jgi:pimeloyl-ACP methyl ester carboxylesterase
MPEDRPLLTPFRKQGSQTAIAFVHGFGGDAAGTWGNFPRLLQDEGALKGWDIFSVGYATKLVPDIVGIWKANAPIDRLAGMFYTAAMYDQLGAYKSLVIISHSMGGLVTQRALVDHDDLAVRVSHIFLFGTPSGGLKKAGPFGFLKRQTRDMGENSEFITDLRKRWSEKFESHSPFRFWTVAGDQDEFVPSDSSLNPFPRNECLVVPGDHLSIVKPASADFLGFKIVVNGIRGDAAPAGPGNAARVAVESREFVRAIQMLEPHKDELDARGLVDLALALEETGRQQDAIALLESKAGEDTDPIGVLAGRLKRRWLAERRRSDAVHAMERYKQGYDLSVAKQDHAQAFYHGINIAFMELAYGSDQDAASTVAADVLKHCGQAKRDFWRLATEGDAYLILGDNATAIARYREAIAMNPNPRQLKSMYQQALRLADLLNEEDVEKQLDALCRGEQEAHA